MQASAPASSPRRSKRGKKSILRGVLRDWRIYVFLALPLLYIFLFNYVPMAGILIAFKDFIMRKGILASPWAQPLFKYFQQFFAGSTWKNIVTNTVLLNVFNLVASFPIPIVFALLLNQLRGKRYRAFIQTTLYAPHFISLVVLAGMMYLFLSVNSGVINNVIVSLGGKSIYFMNDSRWFRTIYIVSGIWQGTGWGMIVYIAALSGVDPGLYEAATIDGANKWQKILHIDIPSIMPMAMMLLILNTGSVFNSEFAKTYLLYQNGNASVSTTIGVWVYLHGIGMTQFSMTAAVGLLTNVLNFLLLFVVNKIAQHVGDGQSSIW
ncbi:MAG: ABC transporter permease subunit [Defluviitaleaceae bacterium]|nr:ABC transporter permease subunit [Defluviitaleaceae bacterium]